MTHKNHGRNDQQHNAPYGEAADRNSINIEDEGADVMDVAPEEDTETAEVNAEEADIDSLRNLIAQKDEEITKKKKEYMFLMAEFDNFRKRTLRERTELIKNASEKVLNGLLPIVDDFERGLDAIKDASDAEAVKEGMKLIYHKLVKYLADNGVKAMESTGADFDAELHEAVAMVPADADTAAGKVKDTVQKGYTLNDKVLRHAKVVVAQ